jgi:replicative DNA helicase
MSQELENKLISIIQNTDFSLNQRLNKLIAEAEKGKDLPELEAPISLLSAIDIEEDKRREDYVNENSIELSDYSFEKQIGSINKGELIVLGGRPAMGKTQFLVHLANQVSTYHPVLFHTIDCSIANITNRFLANETGIAYLEIEQNRLNENQVVKLKHAKEQFSQKKLYLTNNSVLSWYQIKKYYQELVEYNGIEIIIIDYLQLLNDKGHRNREHEVASIMRHLKAIAKELNVCVLVASQISRSVETRGGEKRPFLSDLRESGSIEEFADKVLFIYRPEYYGLTVNEYGESNTNKVEIIVAKNNVFEPTIIQFERDQKFTNFRSYRFDGQKDLSWDFKVDGL